MPLALMILAAAPCVIDGTWFTSRSPLAAVVDTGPATPVSVRHVTARATLQGRRALLEMLAPVAFRASTQRLRLEAKAPMTFFNGAVTLRPGAQVQFVENAADGLRVKLIVEGDNDELENEDKPPLQTISLTHVPCASLTLGEPPLDADAPSGSSIEEEWAVAEISLPLTLHSEASPRAASFTVKGVNGDFAYLIKRQDEWVKLQLNTSDAVQIRGWVPARSAKVLPERGLGRGGGCTGDHHSERAVDEFVGSRPPLYRGSVALEVGTAVFTSCEMKADAERRCELGRVTARVEAEINWQQGRWATVKFAALEGEAEPLWLDGRTLQLPSH